LITTLAISCRSDLVEIHQWLVSYAESRGRDGLGRLGNLREGLQEVAWAANYVVWAHQQVGGSSGRPDPFVGDSREPGRWGPRGTHFSQSSVDLTLVDF
jgi:hypothetical protein